MSIITYTEEHAVRTICLSLQTQRNTHVICLLITYTVLYAVRSICLSLHTQMWILLLISIVIISYHSENMQCKKDIYYHYIFQDHAVRTIRCELLLRWTCSKKDISDQCEIHRWNSTAVISSVYHFRSVCSNIRYVYHSYSVYMQWTICQISAWTSEEFYCSKKDMTIFQITVEHAVSDMSIIHTYHCYISDQCENIRCEFYSICESDGNRAECVCPNDCVDVSWLLE